MSYKHWKQLYLAQFTIFPLLVFLIALISMKWAGTFLPAFIAGGLWCLMFVVVSTRLVFWRCPSCGDYFRGRIFGLPKRFGKADTCAHCGKNINGMSG
jgi:predicted RNA-binding Zn-ribbon protein involved in translation (DUF1610 family)